MLWDTLIGQEGARDYLRAALRAERAAHAFLFHGPAGVGKRTAAALFAQALLCHQPPAPGEACGACKSCRWLQARQGFVSGHPDLLPPLQYDSEGRPTGRVLGDHEQAIPLRAVQALCEQLHRAPSSGRRRVAVVPEAHRLCAGQAEAANAFLKTLEEPPACAVVICTSSRPEALLETVVSRLQPVRFRRLATAEIRRGLGEARAGSSPEAEFVAALADGSLGRARELREGDLGRWRDALMQSLEKFDSSSCPAFGLALWELASAEGERLLEAASEDPAKAREAGGESPAENSGAGQGEAEGESEEEASRTAAGWKRFVFRRLLELCEVAFRDGLVRAAAGPQAQLLQSDRSALAEKLAARMGVAGCERVLEALREALLASRLYVNGALIGRALAGRMVEALR